MLAAGGGGKAAPENVAGFGDNHKCAGVFFAYNLADARYLRQFGNDKQNLALLVGVSAFAVQVSNAAPDDFNNAFGNFFVVFRNVR